MVEDVAVALGGGTGVDAADGLRDGRNDEKPPLGKRLAESGEETLELRLLRLVNMTAFDSVAAGSRTISCDFSTAPFHGQSSLWFGFAKRESRVIVRPKRHDLLDISP